MNRAESCEPALEAELELSVGSGRDAFRLSAAFGLTRGVLALFGPSGAGKSLSIEALAGLVRPVAGVLKVSGECLFDSGRRRFVPAHRRRMGYVPQQNSLFPFRSVAQNVAFGLARGERRRARTVVAPLLEEVGAAHLTDAWPASLSGGERQRVALARALAVRPRLLLLDEPFAAIDREGRDELGRLLLRTLAHHGISAVLVTHDAHEALALADRVARYERGRVVEVGEPARILAPFLWRSEAVPPSQGTGA